MGTVELPNGERVEFPPGTPPGEMQRAIREYLASRNSQRGVGERVARAAGMVGQGFNEGLAQTVGALPDLVGAGMRGLGVPNAPRPGFYTDAVRSGIQAVAGAPQAPETTAERALQGAGRGIADAASILIPATAVAQGARAGSVTQGVGQALAAQPALQATAGAVGGAVGDATDNPLLGTAAAIATPLLLQRGVTPFPSSPERQRMAQAAAAEGIPLSPAQTSGNRALQWTEAAFGDLPTTAGRQAGIEQVRSGAFNRAVLRRAGIDSTTATPEILAANNARLGQEFQRIAAATTVQFDGRLVRDMATAQQRYGNKLPSQQREVFQNFLRDILSDPTTGAPRTTLSGEVYQQARSDLTRLSSSYMNSDPALGRALAQVRDALDDVAGRSVPPDLRDAWQTARRQYAAQRVIERSIGAGENVAEGSVSPLLLRQAVNQQDRRSYALGRGELAELARIGQLFMRPQASSGTAQRAAYMGMLTGAGAVSLDPVTLGTAAALPRTVQEIYNLGPVQRYLQNQAVTTPSPLAGLLTQQGAADIRARVTDSR